MPFLAPFAPAIIKGGIMLGSSILGSKLGKSKNSPVEQNTLDQQTAGMNLLTQQGQEGWKRSNSLLDNATTTAQGPMDYWKSLLSGNKSGITSMLAPEINRIGDAYKTAGDTGASLMPRGGARTEFNSMLPYQQQRDVSTLMQSVRPQAATSLMDAAKSLYGTGSNLASLSTNSIYGATNAGRSLLDFEQKRRQTDRETGAGLGKSIFDLFKNVDLSGIFKGGGKTETFSF